MDRFVTALPTAAKRKRAAAESPAPSMVQQRITDLRKVFSLDAMHRQTAMLKAAIDTNTPGAILPVLESLNSIFMSLEILEETGIGKLVYRLSRHSDCDVAAAAAALYSRWREDAKQSVMRREKKQGGGARKAASRPAGSAAASSHVPAASAGVGLPGAAAVPFMLQDVDIETEMAAWDEMSARASLLQRRPQVAPGSAVPQHPSSSPFASTGDPSETTRRGVHGASALAPRR
jgi:hypothetical protein